MWAYSMGSLELLNAVVKRAARCGASRGRLATKEGNTTRRAVKGDYPKVKNNISSFSLAGISGQKSTAT